jgi:hypothetical protein
MGYWGRLNQELSNVYHENKTFLNELYESDILGFTGMLLIFIAGSLLASLMIILVILLTFKIIPVYPPDPIFNINLFMSISAILFIPLFFGLFLLTFKRRTHVIKETISIKDTLTIKPEIKNKHPVQEKNFEDFTLSDGDFQIIVKQLEKKNVKSICPMCGFETLSLSRYFGFSKHYIRTHDFVESDKGIPTIILACERCGYLMEHALSPLELLDLKKTSEITGDKKDV